MSTNPEPNQNGVVAAPTPPALVRERPLMPSTGTSGAIEVFASGQNFEQAWRMSQALSQSTLVPKDYQGNPSNVLIAMNIASRVKADVFAVMQSLDIIQGRPSWRATFVIAMINTCGRFAPLQFQLGGEGMTRGCIAWTVPYGVRIPLPPVGETALAFAKKTGLPVIEGPEVTMAMAKAEGWIDRSGSKWKTIPELMLRYRSAAFFGRLNAPELLLGMQTAEEEQDRIIEHVPQGPATGVAGARALLADLPAAAQGSTTAISYTAESALAAIRATKTRKEANAVYEPIVLSFVDANKQVPPEVETGYVDWCSHLESQES
jgi:hypothetical protein